MKKVFRKEILSNGLSVVLIPQKESATATVLILVATGSKYETKDINGISHFLEHMCFKGTKKRPRAIDISSELDGLGAEYNAFTGHEYTGYYAKVDSAHTHTALDVVADIYQNQIFDSKEIKKESGVILEEINMYEDNPRRRVQEKLHSLLYGDQPAGWDIAGTKNTVRSIDKKALEKYRSEHYVAGATTVVISGVFDEEKILRDIEKKFSRISRSWKHGKFPVVENQTKPALVTTHKKTDQSHLAFAFRAYPYGDSRIPALTVLATILGGGMSSCLFEVVRERLGAAYYVSASTDLYTDHGYLAIVAGAGNNKVDIVIKEILHACRVLKEKRVSLKEITKAKDYIIGRTALGLETTDAVAMFYGEHYLLGKKLEEPKIHMKKIRDVQTEEILRVAREIFTDKNLNLAYIGPRKDTGAFARLLRV